jgi:hypothetical protein
MSIESKQTRARRGLMWSSEELIFAPEVVALWTRNL